MSLPIFDQLRKDVEENRKRLDTLIVRSTQANVALGVRRYTVADLPSLLGSVALPSGAIAFATNGRKQGEGAGAGTGVLCYWDGVNWYRTSDDSIVVA